MAADPSSGSHEGAAAGEELSVRDSTPAAAVGGGRARPRCDQQPTAQSPSSAPAGVAVTHLLPGGAGERVFERPSPTERARRPRRSATMGKVLAIALGVIA